MTAAVCLLRLITVVAIGASLFFATAAVIETLDFRDVETVGAGG
jgi:hypothetical protein